jgi:hypothetical protein
MATLKTYQRMPTWADVLTFFRFIERMYTWDDAWNCYANDYRANPVTGERAVFVYDATLTVAVDARPHEAA